MISFGLEDEQLLVQETVRKFAAEELRPRLRDFERSGVDAALRRKVHELGLGLIDVPEAYGGQGAPLTTAVIVHEELAFGDPGAAVALIAPHLAAQAILLLGDEAQKTRWLGRFAAGDGALRTGAVAWSERQAPIEGFTTVATRVDGAGIGWSLTGHKAFVVNGGDADLHVVFAQLAGTQGWDGIGAFVVEAGTPGLRAGERHALLGLEAVPAREVILESCVVPDSHRLLGDGEIIPRCERMFARWMLFTAARQVGLARASYEFALEYTQERKAFGKPVAHFQSIAFTLAEMAMDVDAARWLVWRAATELDVGGWPSTVAAAAHANEAAWRVADHGVQLLGGAGYVKDYPVEKWLRDTKALALFAPPSEIAELALAGHELGAPVGTGLPSTALQPFFT
jgi:alkylation response protein AidB-like acyl-CoA dehydrogenase